MYACRNSRVIDVIEDAVYCYNFNDEDEILKLVMQQLNEWYVKPMVRQDIPDTSMKLQECLDMSANQFTDYSNEWVRLAIDDIIIRWCAKKLKELKK